MPPTTFIGALHPSNRNAIAWDERGLIAFGCHSTLAFFDVQRLEIFQTLEQHNTAINLVCWKKQNTDLLGRNKATELRCASSDISGNIIVWDLLAGQMSASFRHSNTPISDLQWLHWPDSCKELLLSLHSHNLLILWDVGNNERLWEHKFAISVYRFSIDPFDASRLAFSSVGSSILLVHDISPARCPSAEAYNNYVNLQLEPTIKSAHQQKSEVQIIQLCHSPATEHLLFVLFPNELCVVELQHRQLISNSIIDAGSPLTQVLPCARRDALFLVHQNGMISFRTVQFRMSDQQMSASMEYVRRCFSEPLRQSMRTRLLAATLCPATQSNVALLMSSGQLVIYQLECSSLAFQPYRLTSIEDMVSSSIDVVDTNNGTECKIAEMQLRLTQYGMYNPLGASVTVVRMRPIDPAGTAPAQYEAGHTPSTELNTVSHLAAVGTGSGIIHLVDIFSGRIERDLQVHSCPVKHLEWCGLNSFISAAYLASLSASSSSTVRNDIFLTDIRSGAKCRIRPEQEESPVEMIRVSHYNCYLAISFRNEPLEIWDLKTFRLLRRMSKRCPIIADMAWSTKHHQLKDVNEKTQIHRENLVVLDNDNHLYHVVVKGLHVRDGKEVSTQWKSGAAFLKCMVWKDDVLAFGDSAGRIGVWDLAKTQCRQSGLSHSTRGPVHRIVFSRLAGDYTLAAQHPTSIVVWDTERLQSVFSLQRSGHSIIDLDMCGLTPVYIASDGMLRFAFSDNEKGRNTSIGESEAPLLLKSNYCEALHSLLRIDCNDPVEKKIFNDLGFQPDNTHFFDRLTNCKTPLRRIIFLLQFAGELSLADFCRVVEAELMAKSIEHEHLPSNLMLFWEKNAYQKKAEYLTQVLLSNYRTKRQLELGIERCVIMQKMDMAIFYLLNSEQHLSDAQNDVDVRLNAFRACTMSANFDSEESRCLVKLTATNLIAANFVSEGIQLLSLIDQALDACKYLISQGHWQRSLSYSKMSPQCDFSEIFMRYADHLSTEMVGRKSLALLFYAGLSCWDRCRTLIAESKSSNQALLRQILNMTENPIITSQESAE